MQVLSTVDLSKSFKGRKVVDDVTLRIAQGEVVGLLGPNGAGKTTTFYIIVGLTTPDAGQVLLDGTDITQFPMYLRARSGISYLPQEPSIFRKLTVEENILAVLETLPLSAHQRRERLEELIEDFGLLLLRQVLENSDGVVGIELAHAFGDGLRRQLLEDFLADGVVDLGQCGEVEVRAHQRDQARAQRRVERLDDGAGVGLVQLADQFAQRRGVAGIERLDDLLDIVGAQVPVVVARGNGGQRRGHVFLVEHAGSSSQRNRRVVSCLYAGVFKVAIDLPCEESVATRSQHIVNVGRRWGLSGL